MLADSEGDFLECEPVYHEGPARYVPGVEESRSCMELCETRCQLEEDNYVIATAAVKDKEQAQAVPELQEALHECELQAIQTCG